MAASATDPVSAPKQAFVSRFRRPGPPRTRRKRGMAAGLVGAVLAGVVLGGCFTGQRPSFESTEPLPTETGNADIDAVLSRLESVSNSVFTADYDILTKMGDVRSTATVVQARPDRRSITINNIRFLYDDAAVATCELTSGECEATINDARVSNVSIGHEFYGPSFAQRLRVDAARRVAEPTGRTITQAGREALCVDVPITGGTVTYCALDTGALARYDGADLLIEMTGFSDAVDESKFATS